MVTVYYIYVGITIEMTLWHQKGISRPKELYFLTILDQIIRPVAPSDCFRP